MILATTTIGDFDDFWAVFSSKGAKKRRQHGCKGSRVFRDPTDDGRLWVVFDWDQAGWESFLSDPDVKAIFEEAGLRGRPEAVEMVDQLDS